MRSVKRLERLQRLRRAEQDRAQLDRAATRLAVDVARERSSAERQRYQRELSRLTQTTRRGASGEWWRAAASGLVARNGVLREHRAGVDRAEREDAAALERLLAARRRQMGLERLVERLGAEARRRAEIRSQRELDERGAMARSTLRGFAALLALSWGIVVAVPAAQAETRAPRTSDDPGVARLLEGIHARQIELSRRQRDLEDRAQHVAELERIATKKLAEIERIAVEVEQRIADWEEAHGAKSIGRLAKIYGSMEPQRAAQLLERLEEELATRIFARMKHKQSAALLPHLSAKRALTMSRNVAHPLSGGSAPGKAAR